MSTADIRRDAAKRGWITAPGFIDLHAHLREPGFEESETVATGARAALAGGFTTICAMPNTEPAIDSPGLVAELIARGAAANAARVLPIATITRGRNGKELADLVELAAAGAVAFSDDGSPVDDPQLFRNALEYARAAGRPILEHSQDLVLSAGGVMHEGVVSAKLGLAGMPAAAEESAISRDLALAKLTGGRLHLSHVSTAGGVELVRRAKAGGARVTAEVTPHHLALTDEWVAGSRAFAWEDEGPRAAPYDTATKVNPPLRTAADVRACWAGLMDRTIDAIATDHAPHASTRKDVEYQEAAFGISVFETAVPLLLMGVQAGWGTWDRVVEALTTGPAGVLGIDLPADDLVVIDPGAIWTATAASLRSLGKNTPLLGRELTGRVVLAVVDGEVRMDLASAASA
ncbi:MAG: dihydroorotase [Chloroflexota bacterium]|nr:dihydroorotase [Chloroflexota bacterium]